MTTSAETEIQAFFMKSSLERAEKDQFAQDAIDELRRMNAERRLQDKRDLDAEYRNYIVPV
jgi:hypothetical protein